MTTPADRYAEWRAALDNATAIARAITGQRVRYIGLTGQTDGPIGRIVRVSQDGVRVRWENGTQDATVHPDDITWLTT